VASINYATREISCKIVYYGPGLSGKTTNLQIIHRKIPDKDKSEMVSLATETDRTLFFDFLPLDLGSIKGFSTKFQLYTVPGQVYYNATRKLVLRGVDGVVFVVDSQVDKLQENLESFANLQENLREYGHSIENIPLVLQYNKRDLPNVYPIEQLNSLINKYKLPHYEAVAATGVGVFTTLKAIGKSVIDKFNAKYAGFQGTRRPARPGEAPAGQAPAAPKPQAPAPGQPSVFGQAPAKPAGQPFQGGFSNPSTPAIPPRPADGSRAPLNVPGAPGSFGSAPGFGGAPGFGNAPGFGAASSFGAAPGFGAAPPVNPFTGNPSGFPGSPNPGIASQAAPISGPAPSGGFGNPGSGFGAPANPFAANPGAPAGQNMGLSPFGSPPGGAARPGQGPGGQGPGGQGPGGFPSFPAQGNPQGGVPPAFPFSGNKPGFPQPGPGGQGPGGQGPGGQGPGGQGPGIPQQAGNMGFNAPPGIPVSPFVESFAGSRPTPPNPPPGIPGMNPPLQSPFGSAGAPPGYGQNRPQPPLGGMPTGGGFPSMPGQNPSQGGFGGQANPGMGGFGNPPAGFGAPPMAPGPRPAGQGEGGGFGGFGGPAAGGFGSPNPMGGQPGNSPFPAPPAKGNPPFPTLSMPAQPEPPQPGRPLGGGLDDNSGIVTTYEDMAKDDSFKTKKLPHPNDKKKGFFDGLFKKEK
jgi:signal recognition particle receptor subunit beta